MLSRLLGYYDTLKIEFTHLQITCAYGVHLLS